MDNSKFNGFPEDVLRFIHELTENNDKAWFEANKQRYTEGVIANAPAFVTEFGERLQAEISPHIQYDTRTNGAGSMLRIHRDTRFSKDKTPYKTNIAFVFWEGARKKMENPSFGFQFGTFGAGIYGGLWNLPKELLEPYREAVVDTVHGEELWQALEDVKNAGDYEIKAEAYKRVPSGYDPDHPAAELLKYKGLYAMSPQFDIELVTRPELVDVCVEHCKNMAPLQQWLARLDRANTT